MAIDEKKIKYITRKLSEEIIWLIMNDIKIEKDCHTGIASKIISNAEKEMDMEKVENPIMRLSINDAIKIILKADEEYEKEKGLQSKNSREKLNCIKIMVKDREDEIKEFYQGMNELSDKIKKLSEDLENTINEEE